MSFFSDYFIAKQKSFWGVKSIDPPVPFEDFLAKNFKDLKILIEKKQLIVIDGDGNEVDNTIWEHHILDFYENKGKNTSSALDNLEKIQDILEQINILKSLEKAKVEHKNRLIESMKKSKGVNKVLLDNGIEKVNHRIIELQNEQKSLLAQIKQNL